jgi:LPPG:FO 2-phospho-L-lactate transferase
MGAPVVVLAGGTGGAKLARGLLDVCGEDLVAIVNTGDDVEMYGAYVSPDPDLVTFWLADRIDERGWGLRGDTFHVMDGLRELGVDVWFNLGDRDLALCLERARRLAAGDRLTDVQRDVARAYGVTVPVLPMCEEPVRTKVKADGAWWDFQEFMIRHGGAARDFRGVEDVRFDGIDHARPTGEVLEAIAAAEVVLVGPSNPIISVGPILQLPGLREALLEARAPVVAVSPVVGGRSMKGPTEDFLRWAGVPLDGDGIAAHYGTDLLTGIVCDDEVSEVPSLRTDTMLATPEDRARVAREALTFARALV